MSTTALPTIRVREFLPQEFKISVWSKLKPYYNELLKRSIHSVADLERWILDESELDALFEEELHRRYIRMIANMQDDRASSSYEYALYEITPNIKAIKHELNLKLLKDPFFKKLNKKLYKTYIRSVQSKIDTYHKDNLLLLTEIETLSIAYGKAVSSFNIIHNQKEYSLTEVKSLLQHNDRLIRKQIFIKVSHLFSENITLFNSIFDNFLEMRHQQAINSKFKNYRDYRFKELGRYDYTAEDCHEFHESIAEIVCPIVEQLHINRKKIFALDQLRPWDLTINSNEKEHLLPASNPTDLVEKTIGCLNSIHPYFGSCIQVIQEMNHLDLEPRNNKQSGSFMISLPLTGVPFIHMNLGNTIDDLRSFTHECGHAIHNFLFNKHRLHVHRQVPKELTQLSAMTMELLVIENGHYFFDSQNQVRKAKKYLLESILYKLPWIATIDRFQHWLYKHPEHTEEERNQAWLYIHARFNSSMIDYEGFENDKTYAWHRQIHIFNYPFYFIEYAIAQLGAIAIWKQYLESPQETIHNFVQAMELGYTIPVKEVYHKAGINFDTSKEYIDTLVSFVQTELKKLD